MVKMASLSELTKQKYRRKKEFGQQKIENIVVKAKPQWEFTYHQYLKRKQILQSVMQSEMNYNSVFQYKSSQQKSNSKFKENLKKRQFSLSNLVDQTKQQSLEEKKQSKVDLFNLNYHQKFEYS